MSHTPEQLDIIKRMADVSRQFDEAVTEQRITSQYAGDNMIIAGQGLVMVAKALVRSMERLRVSMEKSSEIVLLNQQHGELFRQYLDTVIKRNA